MANSYASSTFVLDTDTNVAGLTALKGSAPALTDYICIKNMATLTVESDLSCLQMNVGFGAINGASASYGLLVVNDGVLLTFGISGRFYSRAGSFVTMNGTMQSIGTSNGTADQTFSLLRANNTSVKVAGTWWELVPDLTGKTVQCSAATNVTVIPVATDPRVTGLSPGVVVDLINPADGTVLASGRTLTSVTGTTVTISGAVVTTTTSYWVYRRIAATDTVYSVSGDTLTFGDGQASAWNNAGGAIPANGSAITSPGIAFQSSNTSSKASFYDTSGYTTCNGVDFYAMTYSQWTFYLAPSVVLADCGFHDCGNAFPTISYCSGVVVNRCVFYRTSGWGIYISGCEDARIESCYSYAHTLGSFNLNSDVRMTVANSRATAPNQNAFTVYGCSDLLLAGCSATNSFTGFGIGSNSRRVRLVNCVAINNSNANIYCDSNNKDTEALGCRAGSVTSRYQLGTKGGIQAYRTGLTGTTGTVLWTPTELRQAAGSAMNSGYSNGLYLKAKDYWWTSNACWIPGLASYGVFSVSESLAGRTSLWQYRQSHDYGQTWTAWATVTEGQSPAEAPNTDGEYIQFRVSLTDSGTAWANLQSLWISCTFAADYLAPIPANLPDYVGGLTA